MQITDEHPSTGDERSDAARSAGGGGRVNYIKKKKTRIITRTGFGHDRRDSLRTAATTEHDSTEHNGDRDIRVITITTVIIVVELPLRCTTL